MAAETAALDAIAEAVKMIVSGESVLDPAIEIELSLKRAGFYICKIHLGRVNNTRQGRLGVMERYQRVCQQRDNASEELALLRAMLPKQPPLA